LGGEEKVTCKVEPHFSKLLEHTPTLHIALYFSGDRTNTPHKKEKKIKSFNIIKAISCHHSVQEYHCSKNVMLKKTIWWQDRAWRQTHTPQKITGCLKQ